MTARPVLTALGPARNSWQVSPGRVELVRPSRPTVPLAVPARPQEVVLDLARCALVIVDMQNDFCAEGGWLHGIGVDVTATRAPIAGIAALLPAVRHAGMPVVWLNWGNRPDRANLPPGVVHVYNRDGGGVGLGDPLPGSGAPVLERGSWASQVVDELEITDGDIRIDKYRMSGFFDTELDSVLRNLDATTILFAGVNVDQCVLATLSDAACLGYDCILLEDCCATSSPPYCFDATLYNVQQVYGFVASGAELLAALAALGAPGER